MWKVFSPCTVAGSSILLPGASESSGCPALSVNETAPVARSTITCSFAVARVKPALDSLVLKRVAAGNRGTLSIEVRLKKSGAAEYSTRTIESESTWIRSSPEVR